MSLFKQGMKKVLGIRDIEKPFVVKAKKNAVEELLPMFHLSKQISTDSKREEIYEDMLNIQSGLDGENQVMYELKNSGIPMLIHQDIRIEIGEQTAQMDFIVITPRNIIILETKKLIGDISINSDGDFIRSFKGWNGKVYKKESMYSPYVQNLRHKKVLEQLLVQRGMNVSCNIVPVVLLANPKSILDKKYAPKDIKNTVFKAEQSGAIIAKSMEGIPLMPESKMREISKFLMDNHIPIAYDLKEKYNIQKDEFIDKVDNPTLEELESFVKDLKNKRKEFARDKKSEKEKAPEVKSVETKIKSSSSSNTDGLEQNLKSYRYNKSKEEKVPQYVIFTNSELESLLSESPSNIKELKSIKGFGEKKIEKYGKEILNILNEAR